MLNSKQETTYTMPAILIIYKKICDGYNQVIGNSMTTVLTSNGRTKNERQNNFRQSRLAILRKSKREATPRTSQRKLLHICFYPNAQ